MQPHEHHIIMVASENDALINGKVGGLADVIRDLPVALSEEGLHVTVITPSYGFLHRDNPAKEFLTLRFPFMGRTTEGTIWEVTPKERRANLTHLVLEHPELRGTPIYSIDPPGEPFAQDATKFALFSSAVGQYLKNIPPPSVIHLHDWHTPTLLLLRDLHPSFQHLRSSKVVFTIHNLAYQGSRPFRGEGATVEQWFPELFREQQWINLWMDSRYEEATYTPLAVGIRFSDRVNTVSPTYAEEILRPSNQANGFYGGEGLENILQDAKREDKLFGILNGCTYPSNQTVRHITWSELSSLIVAELSRENNRRSQSLLTLMIERLQMLRNTTVPLLLTSITRVNEQKLRLLFEGGRNGRTPIEEILSFLRIHGGYYIVLGVGDPKYERLLEETSRANERFFYLPLYSNAIADALYENGSMFLMPSSFEPCGISQMVAMRSGQPCIVNAVGGLKDTVIDHVNGFQFSGRNIREQADQFTVVTKRAIELYFSDREGWERVRQGALLARFEWRRSAREYINLVYGITTRAMDHP